MTSRGGGVHRGLGGGVRGSCLLNRLISLTKGSTKSRGLQRLAVTLDRSALWAIAASFEELRGKTGHAAKRAVLQSKVSGPTSLQSAIVAAPALFMPVGFRETDVPEAQFPRRHLLGGNS